MDHGIGVIINTQKDIEQGMQHLCRVEPRFQDAYALTHPLPLRRVPDGFATLLKTIVGQQVSIASASAIWARMSDAGLTCAPAVAQARMDVLRSHGLSKPKATYATALAMAGVGIGRLWL